MNCTLSQNKVYQGSDLRTLLRTRDPSLSAHHCACAEVSLRFQVITLLDGFQQHQSLLVKRNSFFVFVLGFDAGSHGVLETPLHRSGFFSRNWVSSLALGDMGPVPRSLNQGHLGPWLFDSSVFGSLPWLFDFFHVSHPALSLIAVPAPCVMSSTEGAFPPLTPGSGFGCLLDHDFLRLSLAADFKPHGLLRSRIIALKNVHFAKNLTASPCMPPHSRIFASLPLFPDPFDLHVDTSGSLTPPRSRSSSKCSSKLLPYQSVGVTGDGA